MAIAIVLIELFVTNHMVHMGKAIQDIDRKMTMLRDENDLLSQNVASASSLAAIEVRAREAGFVPTTQYLTIGKETFTVALGHTQ